tara:strand:+ start:7574 stop:8392 length:819 start_codon:yes stop_codon:yes gene_type:complete
MLAFLTYVNEFLSSFFTDPEGIPASSWCLNQPCLEIFGIRINQFSSSILVYTLAFYGLFVGYKYYQTQGGQKSRLYWSISLVLGGIGAFSAGSSFQAFAFTIKCAGKEFCDATSLFEVAYNILTVWSAGFLCLAIGVTFLRYSKMKTISIITLGYCLVFTLLSLAAFKENLYLLVSFEFLLLYLAPVYLSIITITIYQHIKNTNESSRKHLIAWLTLMLTLITYYLYLNFHFTELLWSKGIWFSANDVLHLGMIGWLYYLSNGMMGVVEDYK